MIGDFVRLRRRVMTAVVSASAGPTIAAGRGTEVTLGWNEADMLVLAGSDEA
jgi:hypothetical protein